MVDLSKIWIDGELYIRTEIRQLFGYISKVMAEYQIPGAYGIDDVHVYEQVTPELPIDYTLERFKIKEVRDKVPTDNQYYHQVVLMAILDPSSIIGPYNLRVLLNKMPGQEIEYIS